ncbi:MAG: ATP-dependent Clp protease ATP-binding subunit [Patescibacteria group bacterium]|nr:ATP-dependent Clp protease ATP-binding subunit [Patescibacteria group bacterium]
MPGPNITIPPIQYFPWSGPAGNRGNKKAEQAGSLLGWFNGQVIYWKRPINEFSLWLTRLKEFSQKVYLSILIIFGAFGLLLGFWKLSQVWSGDISLETIWETRAPEFFLFWVAVLVFEYVFFRLSWESQKQKMIRRAPPAPSQLARVDFSVIAGIPQRQWIDVSHFFTRESLKAIERAVNLGHALKHPAVEPLHLLSVICRHKDVQLVFARLGVTMKVLSDKVNRTLKAKNSEGRGSPPLSQGFYQLLFGAYEEAYRRRSKAVEIPDLLTAMMKTGREAQAVLYDLDIELEDLRNVVIWINIQSALRRNMSHYRSQARFKPKGNMNRAMTAVATPFLDRFSTDLTQLAKAGYLPYCVNREQEIESIYRAVESESNGVVLIGNPGVGRRTIIAGLAERMVTEDVPVLFRDKRLVSLSLSSLVAGASAPGELEQRLLGILADVIRSGNIILVVQDIHNMVGVTTERGEGLDLSEVFTEYVNKKSFIVIATSNPIEYRRYVETGALGECLRRIPVEEMDENQTILVLEAKAGAVEYQQQVYFSYDAIAAIVKFSQRFIHERYLPEKATQFMEEVGAYVRRTRGKRKIVTSEDVAQVVSAKVGVPVTKVTEKESQKLLHLEERIHGRLVGQDEAVKMVAESLRRARAELRDLKRPIVNLLFLGPTGVGKTELAKTVAEVYFGSEEAMIRVDMSEYQESKSIDRLIGAPPGLTKGEEGGYLTEAVRRQPFSLLLLDEIEKAHPDILNVFLQVMDDGRLTDSLGRTIDFTNVILIATSNAGTPLIQQRVRENKPIMEIRDELINTELSKYFRPEFLNRFDGIMVFRPLAQEELYQVAELLLGKVAGRLEEKGISLKATPEAIAELVQEGYDPAFGARPLRRVIQNKVDNALANHLLQGKLTRRDVAVLEPGGVIRVEKAERL